MPDMMPDTTSDSGKLQDPHNRQCCHVTATAKQCTDDAQHCCVVTCSSNMQWGSASCQGLQRKMTGCTCTVHNGNHGGEAYILTWIT